MADFRPVPLTVTIGESVFALGKRAPGLVRPDATADDSSVLVTRLVELTVVAGDRPLALPPTRFAAIEQVAGVVTGVKTAPMIGYARLKPTNGLAKWLINHARASGWTLAEGTLPDLDALRTELAAPVRQPVRTTYAVLRRGAASLRVVLEETATRPRDIKPRAHDPLFLVHTDFTDKPLRDAQLTRMFARRKQMTGGTRSVPLSAWAGL